MIPIQEYPCLNSIQLCIQEEKVRQELEANLNSQNAYTSKEERVEQVKEYNAKYREQNKEAITEYRENNREKLAEQQKEKFTCDCGSICSKGNKSKHEKTKKHLAYLESL